MSFKHWKVFPAAAWVSNAEITVVSHALCYKRTVSFDGSCFLFISSCYNSVVLLYGKSIMGGPSMFLTRKRWLVFELCNFLLLFTEEPQMNLKLNALVVLTATLTLDLPFHLSSRKVYELVWPSEASFFVSQTHTHTHTHLYLITVTLNPACSAFELSISGDITSLTSLPPLKERLIRSNCSGPIRSGHLFLHLRTGFTWTWCNQHYVTVGLHNVWDIYIFSIIWWIQYNMLIWCSNKKKYIIRLCWKQLCCLIFLWNL